MRILGASCRAIARFGVATRQFYHGNDAAEAAQTLFQRHEDGWRRHDVEKALADAGWVDPNVLTLPALCASLPAQNDLLEALRRCAVATDPVWPRDAVLALVAQVLCQHYPRLLWCPTVAPHETSAATQVLSVLCDVIAAQFPCHADHAAEHCVVFVATMWFVQHGLSAGAGPLTSAAGRMQQPGVTPHIELWQRILRQHEVMVTAAVAVTGQMQLRRLSIALHPFLRAASKAEVERTDVGQLLSDGNTGKLPGIAVGMQVQQLWSRLTPLVDAIDKRRGEMAIMHDSPSYWASSAKDPTAALPDEHVAAINAQLSSIGRRSSPETVLGG